MDKAELEAVLADGVDNKTPLLDPKEENGGDTFRTDQSKVDTVDMCDSDTSHSEIYHPNDPRYHKKKHVFKGCAKYLNRFDEMIMRPIFIYRYEKSLMKKSKEFINLFMKHGEEIQEDFYQSHD